MMARTFGDRYRLERRRRRLWFQFSFTSLLDQVGDQSREPGGVVHPAHPDAIGAKSLGPTHLMG